MLAVAPLRLPGPVASSSASVPISSRDELRGTLLTRYLEELRGRLGADETIIWRVLGETVTPAAWSSGNEVAFDLDGDKPEAVPRQFRFDAWMPLVQWAGRQRLVQCWRGGAPLEAPAVREEPNGSPVIFAVAPVDDELRGYFALSASADGGLRMSEDQVRSALVQSARYAADLADLLHTQRQSERQVRHANVLVNSAKMFQSKRSEDGLAQTVCRDALQITGGARAALVRWDGGAQSGYVQSVSPGNAIEAGQQVVAHSRVGELCTDDQAQVWEDARQMDRELPIYGPGETVPRVGSLLIVPMKREQLVVGAIVVEGNAALDVQNGDIGPVRTLAAIASASLAQLWQLDAARRASITDQLTGLSNRRHFDEQLLRLLSAADQKGQPLSLIVADVDHFKRVNDTYGHEAGDAVLQAVAAIVQRTVRTSAGDICARYGGEEVAILLPGVPAIEALEVAERLRRHIAAKPVTYAGQRILITASFGVASYPETVSTHPSLFPSADRALYQAKSDGRNRVKSAGGSVGVATTSVQVPRVRRVAG